MAFGYGQTEMPLAPSIQLCEMLVSRAERSARTSIFLVWPFSPWVFSLRTLRLDFFDVDKMKLAILTAVLLSTSFSFAGSKSETQVVEVCVTDKGFKPGTITVTPGQVV
jgi:hypothetical protein